MKTFKNAIHVAIIMAILPLLATSELISQPPQKMSYQAVIRNSSDELVKDTQIGIQVSILKGTSEGTVVYSETQTPFTNANGMLSIEIGGEADFSAIDWSAGPYFIKTEIAIEAPLTNYAITGTSQIMSVPYAMTANIANFAASFDKLTLRGELVCDESTEGTMRYNPDTRFVEYCNGSNWIALGSGLTINLPMLITSPATSITTNSAISGGVVSDNGGAEIIEKGVCWETENLPTISNNKTMHGIGSASFESSLTGLLNNTLYYTRAYATNTVGTGYGEEREFTTLASLTTQKATEITSNSIVIGGDIVVGGGQAITERGIVYATTANPSILDNKVIDATTGTGSFSVTLNDLLSGTLYYYRAYAKNAGGLSYGNEHTISIFTDSRDGNAYSTVWVGEKEWMAENLAYIPSVSPSNQGSHTSPYYYVYDYQGTNVTEAKATSNYHTYGVLYNYTSALSACPAGWHLPTDAEWTELENYLIANGYNYDGSTTGDKVAKSLATSTGWDSSSTNGAIGNTDYSEKRNATGFSALPGGSRYNDNSFKNAGRYGYWWSATEYSITRTWYRGLGYNGGDLFRYGNDHGLKDFGFSVRCLRD